MRTEHQPTQDERIQAAVTELQEKVLGHYPDATFEVFQGEDPEGTYLEATVDVEDSDEVMDVVIDRLVDLQVEERLPLYFVVARPIERVLEQMRAARPTHSRVAIEDIITPLHP